MEGSQVTILLAEDDPGHARLIEKNLRRAGIANDIIHATDGQVALDYCFGRGDFMGHKRANQLLILLDLNMPVMDGYHVIEKLKSEPLTHNIPIIVLTTTDERREIQRCYEMGCNVYVTKPVEYTAFTEAIRKLGLFLSVIQVPSESVDP